MRINLLMELVLAIGLTGFLGGCSNTFHGMGKDIDNMTGQDKTTTTVTQVHKTEM